MSTMQRRNRTHNTCTKQAMNDLDLLHNRTVLLRPHIVTAMAFILHVLLIRVLITDSHAEQSITDNWYHVEICLFTNTTSEAEQIESWPSDISIYYQKPLVLLKNEATQVLEENAETSELASNSVITASESTIIPFTVLPPEQYTLTNEVTKIAQSPMHRVLNHLAWLQPIDNQANAVSIALHGGDETGKHYELEGSIKLFRERYLHIETNLWLSDFAINLGQEVEPWPLLPKQPYLADSLNIEQDTPLQLQWNDQQIFGRQYQFLITTEYVNKRIAKMSQHRKMRSKELHYIDHPLFGLLIRITPYEPAEPSNAEKNDDDFENP